MDVVILIAYEKTLDVVYILPDITMKPGLFFVFFLFFFALKEWHWKGLEKKK